MAVSPVDSLAAAVMLGLGATAIIDVWSLMLAKVFRVKSLSFCLVGRWFLHMPAGRFVHEGMASAALRRGECAVGWAAHYLIGVAFAIAFVVFMGVGWLQSPTVLPAVGFGLLTVVFPFLVMQPAMGLGVAASRSPAPAKARIKSATTHALFGLGLYLAALPICAWLKL